MELQSAPPKPHLYSAQTAKSNASQRRAGIRSVQNSEMFQNESFLGVGSNGIPVSDERSERTAYTHGVLRWRVAASIESSPVKGRLSMDCDTTFLL